MLVLNLLAFSNKKYTAYGRFHRNGPYGKITTKEEPIRTLGFALPYNKVFYKNSKIYLKCFPCSDLISYWKFNSYLLEQTAVNIPSDISTKCHQNGKLPYKNSTNYL